MTLHLIAGVLLVGVQYDVGISIVEFPVVVLWPVSHLIACASALCMRRNSYIYILMYVSFVYTTVWEHLVSNLLCSVNAYMHL